MHKLLPTVFALLLVLLLAGCVKTPPVSNTDETTHASTQATTAEVTKQTEATTSTEEQPSYGDLHFPEGESETDIES